jgi:hypothetical protein
MSESDSTAIFSSPKAAEVAFYQAFADCDIQAMDAVWAHSDVICIHPGSRAIVGREAVMRSWTNILSQAEPLNLQVELLKRTEGNGLAVHLVEERIRPMTGSTENATVVLATNIYSLQADGWRLLQHHASKPNTRQITH